MHINSPSVWHLNFTVWLPKLFCVWYYTHNSCTCMSMWISDDMLDYVFWFIFVCVFVGHFVSLCLFISLSATLYSKADNWILHIVDFVLFISLLGLFFSDFNLTVGWVSSFLTAHQHIIGYSVPNSTVVPPGPKGHYRIVTGNHTLRINCNNGRAAPMTGSTQSCVLVPFDFDCRRLNDDSVIAHIQVLFLFFVHFSCLQCFDAVGWAAGRASGL